MTSSRWTTRIAFLTVAPLVAVGLVSLAAPPPAHALGSPTVTTVSSSQNPSPACTPVTFTATVFGALFPDSPLGGVQFFDGTSTLGGIQVITPDFDTFLGAHVVPTNHSSATVTAALSGGSHLISAVYAGTDVPSRGGPLVQNVTAGTSSTTVTSSVDPSVYGQPVTFDAAVSSACAGGVAGSVQFSADGAALGAAQPVDGSGHARFTTADLGAATHPVSAVFTSTNATVGGSSGALPGGQVVQPAATTTGVTSSANPSEYGANVTFTSATAVTAPGGGTPTGGVQFSSDGAALGGPRPLAGGSATASTTSLSVGSHAITASYASDSANYTGSTGSTTQVVNRARTTLTYDGATGADYHDTALLSARLARTDDSTPVAGQTIALGMGAESCTASTGPDGEAACSVTPADPAGPFTATAAFAGDGNYLPSADARSFTVLREETVTTYTGPTVIAQGNPVVLSGRLLEDGVVPIAGRPLTLTLGSGATAQSCGTPPTDASGNAQCSIALVTVGQGPQPVSAAFAGDAYYLPSSDTGHQLIVFAFPSRGVFLLGAANTSPSGVTFWGAHWSELNGGTASPSAKGFASTTTAPPACGSRWTTGPGNSADPVGTLPAYMGTAVTTPVTKNGSTLSGVITSIVVVVTNGGYAPDPGHPGTGTVVATYC